MNTTFYLHTQADRSGKRPIFWCYSHRSKKARGSTGFKIHPNNWNDKARLPKTVRKSDRILRKLLLKLQEELEEIALTIRLNDKTPMPSMVKAEYDKRKNVFTVGQAWARFEDDHLSKKAKNTKARFGTTRNNLAELSPSWSDFTAEWGDKFIAHLERKSNKYDTATKKLSDIAIFLRFCLKKGYHKDSAFELWPKHKKLKTKKIFLTSEEIDKIREAEMPSERLQRAKDLLLFHCITGLAYVDGQSLEKTLIDVENRRVALSRMKTKVEFDLPLNDEMIAIIEKYEGVPTISNAKGNVYMKEVGELAGIDQPVKYRGKMVPKFKAITTHTGRTSFITNLLIAGAPITLVSKLVGHASIKTTAAYDQSGYKELRGVVDEYL